MKEFTAVVLVTDTILPSGRMYPKEVVEDAVKRAPKMMLGYLAGCHEAVSDAAVMVDNVSMEDGSVIVRGKFLTTPKGIKVSNINPDLLEFTLSGVGKAERKDDAEVITDYKIEYVLIGMKEGDAFQT